MKSNILGINMNKKYILVIIALSFFIFSQASFAETIDDNATLQDTSQDALEDVQTSEKTIFIISDNPGTNIIDSAAEELYNKDNLTGFNLVVRSGEQVKDMNEGELKSLFESSDAFIGEWISTDVDSVLTNLLGKYPELSHKELFLILELPSGNMNSGSTSINLIRNNTINYNKIFTQISNDEIIDYFKNTKRGLQYSDVDTYITNHASKFDSFFIKPLNSSPEPSLISHGMTKS